MNKSRILIIISLMLFSGCFLKKPTHKDELPECVKTRIDNLKRNKVQNPPAEVWKWETDKGVFYYFNSPCCDIMSTLVDSDCQKICSPDGGYTGRGDGKCPEFKEVKKTLIWEDERK